MPFFILWRFIVSNSYYFGFFQFCRFFFLTSIMVTRPFRYYLRFIFFTYLLLLDLNIVYSFFLMFSSFPLSSLKYIIRWIPSFLRIYYPFLFEFLCIGIHFFFGTTMPSSIYAISSHLLLLVFRLSTPHFFFPSYS